jgi:hypothetical protein
MDVEEAVRSVALTLDGAIAQLEALRCELGGDAPLLMVDYCPVTKFNVEDDVVTVSDMSRHDAVTVAEGGLL